MQQSVAQLHSEASAVFELQEVFGVLTPLQSGHQRIPNLGKLLGSPVMPPLRGHGESCGRLDADFKILAGLDRRCEGIVGFAGPRGFS